MLFNSYEFIFLFLPAVVVGFYWLIEWGRPRVALAWLTAASLLFYAWWDYRYLALILASIVANYYVAQALARGVGRRLLTLGIAGNLLALGYFKYANFFVDNLNVTLGSSFELARIALPLAISFFTFQQIAYLVDAYRGKAGLEPFLHYALFVTFFPQLIAGPIVHHREMLPQFARKLAHSEKIRNCAVGTTIFSIGLFKKVVLADTMAEYATPVFGAAEQGGALSLLEAWGGALAYGFQLYFDFSGYADMAIGAARLFGIRLPLNFYSPYKATSIIEFWRRWHMTLSRFLRDYLYVPLGGNRKGRVRRYVNLMITMTLGGLWHGAGWTFVIWGALHGLYLGINHAWRAVLGSERNGGGIAGGICAGALTFVAVTVAWVFFRAESVGGAIQVLEGMAGLNGVALPAHYADVLGPLAQPLALLGVEFGDPRYFRGPPQVALFAVCALIVWGLPNTAQFMHRYKPVYDRVPRALPRPYRLVTWRATPVWAVFAAWLGLTGILGLSGVSEFIYFQF